MFDIGAPYRGAELVQAMLALELEGSDLNRGFSLPVFFAPQGRAWSPADHLRHLRKTTLPISLAFYLPARILRLGFGTSPSTPRSYAEVRDEYRASLSKSTSAGLFAPRPQTPAGDLAVRRAAILHSWHSANARFAAAVQRWPEADLDRYRLPHPRLGPLSLREMAAFTVYHTAHDLARIGERAGTPALGGS